MSKFLKSWAPVACVLVAAMCCCWPYLTDPMRGGQAATETVLPRVQGRLPASTPNVALARDPFVPRPVRPALSETRDNVETTDASLIIEEPSGPPAPIDDRPNVLEGLVLNGTLIQGNSRFAIINQRLYEAGSSVVAAGPSTEAVILKQVLGDRVMVSHQGRILELKYQDLVVQSKPLPADTQDDFGPQ